LFTRKLESALRFMGAPFEMRNKRHSAEKALIEQRAGTHQVPVLITPENWALSDTSPIIDLLGQRYPARRLVSEGELGVLATIVEEYLDEWSARVMVHYRWHYPESTAFAAAVIAQGDPDIHAFITGWGPRACRATGTETAFHQLAAEAEYLELLQQADAQLSETRFLMGDRPSVVDCMVLGGFRAHTLHDPDPRKVVNRFPRLLAWNETAEQGWIADDAGEWAPFPETTAFARHVVKETATHYAPFLLSNGQALRAGARTHNVATHGEPASYLTRPYPEASRRLIRERIVHRLTTEERRAVEAWLDAAGLAQAFSPAAQEADEPARA
jgi:glutathione S-transferase